MRSGSTSTCSAWETRTGYSRRPGGAARPVFLAGGLNAVNVAEAIVTVRPFAVDVCSGLRDEGFDLDLHELTRFAAAVECA